VNYSQGKNIEFLTLIYILFKTKYFENRHFGGGTKILKSMNNLEVTIEQFKIFYKN
jgi:hypothetical protein